MAQRGQTPRPNAAPAGPEHLLAWNPLFFRRPLVPMAYQFDTIAANYDRMNRIMTIGLDRLWRKRAVREILPHKCTDHEISVLDVACGTGDMMVCLAESGCTVTGVDISEEMLAIAKQKTASSHFPPSSFSFHLGDAEHLPFEDNTFDAVTCAFGVRNFVHLEQGLNEMLRILKPGGIMAILELATPDSPLVRPFYNLYARRIIPWLGSRLAGNRDAYTYLPESIVRFPKGDAFLNILNNLNCKNSQNHRKLTMGVCRLYLVKKVGEAM